MHRLLVLLSLMLAGCSAANAPQATPPASSLVATATTAASPAAEPTDGTTLAARCVRPGTQALPGVVEARPDGWFELGEVSAIPGFANTHGRVYAPNAAPIPPSEGPGRLALYETAPASGAYLKSRIEQSRTRGGRPIAVTICGEATEAWSDESTGELVVGWTDRDKSGVLVANTADLTVQELVDAAESVSDCCG